MATMYELCHKDVVNVKTGEKLGRANDIEFSLDSAIVSAVIIYGRRKLFGLLGREPDVVIPWGNIERVGDDVILIHDKGLPPRPPAPRRPHLYSF